MSNISSKNDRRTVSTKVKLYTMCCSAQRPSCYLNNSVDRTGFLAEATVDALGHIDVIASGSPAAISSRLSLNSNGLQSPQEQKRETEYFIVNTVA